MPHHFLKTKPTDFISMKYNYLIAAMLFFFHINTNADTWTFYNNVWANKIVADGSPHTYDTSGNQITTGGLTFCFNASGLVNTTTNDLLGMWFYSDYDSATPMNYIKVSVPANTKVTATGSVTTTRYMNFILGGTTYKMTTDTFTVTNNASSAVDLIICGLNTVKSGVSYVGLFKLAIGDELQTDDGPLKLDYSWVTLFKNYGISGPGIPVEGNGRGGWKSGPNPYTRYQGNHLLPIYKTDDWGNTSSGTAVDQGLVPPILPILELHVRDAVVTRGGDGYYYMTGSTGHNIWIYANGIELWRSKNLANWEYVGLVWDIDKEADQWVKDYRGYKGYAVRAVWAPEIHYLPKHNNYYICFSMCPSGIGILKSSTGKPEGPYVNAWAVKNTMVVNGIDPTLFEDEDGTVYFTYSSAPRIYKLTDDLSAFDGTPVTVTLENPDTNPTHHAARCSGTDLGTEGAVMFKANGKYYLGAADTYEGRYSSCMAIADNVYGPYRMRHEPAPCDGGTGFFQDFEGNWWTSYFGNDNSSHFREKCGLIKMAFADDGRMYPTLDQPFVPSDSVAGWQSRWNGVWKNKYADATAIKEVGAASHDKVSAVRKEHFTLSGMHRNAEANGITIIRYTYADGKFKTEKVVR